MTHKSKIKCVGLSLNLDTPLGYGVLENTIPTRGLAPETFPTMHLEDFLRHFYYSVGYTEIKVSQIQDGFWVRLSRGNYCTLAKVTEHLALQRSIA